MTNIRGGSRVTSKYNEEEKRRYGKDAHLRKLISVCKRLKREVE